MRLAVGGWRLAVGGWRLAVGGWRLGSRMHQDRGRDGGVNATPPSEPDWPISSIRLSSRWGLCVRLTINTGAVFQTKQPLPRKPSVGPSLTVGLAQPISGSFLPFAQHCPKASSQPPVRITQSRRMAVPEV